MHLTYFPALSLYVVWDNCLITLFLFDYQFIHRTRGDISASCEDKTQVIQKSSLARTIKPAVAIIPTKPTILQPVHVDNTENVSAAANVSSTVEVVNSNGCKKLPTPLRNAIQAKRRSLQMVIDVYI